MRELWQRLKRNWSTPPSRGSRRRPTGFMTLESRRLQAIVPLGLGGRAITAAFNPQVLPNTGQLVPVAITGVVTQGVTAVLDGHLTKEPSEPSLSYIKANLLRRAQTQPLDVAVTDQYRQYEPRISTELKLIPSDPLHFHTTALDNFVFNPAAYNAITKTWSPASEQVLRAYSYTATIFIQAKANPGTHGRRYTVTVSTSDADSGAAVNFAVVVPRK